MLNKQEAWIIGRNRCIELLGEEFCNIYRENVCGAHGMIDGKMHCFIGIDDKSKQDERIRLTEEKFPYYASIYVNMENGNVEVGECNLPN